MLSRKPPWLRSPCHSFRSRARPKPVGFSPWTLEDLSASQGFGWRLGPFDVPPGQQVQDCYFRLRARREQRRDTWINRFRIALIQEAITSTSSA